jgi:hypothetical protein
MILPHAIPLRSGLRDRGHVPADAIKRLLAEKPAAKGLALHADGLAWYGDGGHGAGSLRGGPVRCERPQDLRPCEGARLL